MKIILIFFIAITLKAQFVLTSGNYRHTSVSIGDTNSTFSDTTTVGDWIYTENDSVYNGSDSTLIGYHEDGYVGLPLASVDGQDYRATMQMMEYDGTVAPQPIISYGTKSLTYTALSDSWQTYTFDFEGEKVNDYYSFDGTDDVITVADDNSLRVGENDYSLEWYGQINANNSAGVGSFLIGKGINGESFGLCLYGDLIAFAHRGDATSYDTFSHDLGEYYHFVMTKTSTYIYSFIDGIKTDSVSISGNTYTESNEAFKIGQNSFSGSSTYGNINTKLARIYNKALSQSEITTLYNNRNSTSATTVTDSLVLDLNGIDGNSSSTVWTDMSHDSTKEAYSFDGTDDVITVADDNSLDFGTGEFAYEFMAKWEDGANGALIGNTSGATSGIDFAVRSSDELFDFYLRNPNVNVMGVSQAPYEGTKTHFVVTRESDDSVKTYINGDLVATVYATNNITSALDFYIGDRASALTFNPECEIYNVRAYNKALTPTEVATLYSERDGYTTTVTDSLVLDLNMDSTNVSASTWTDDSGNGNDGTVTSATPFYLNPATSGTVNGATFKQPPYLEISLSDTAKGLIDNVTITR